MSLIYRSPNIIIGDFEWHLSVSNRCGRVAKQFYFRPLSAVRYKWERMPMWRDRLPDRFGERFQTYRKHAILAIEAEKVRPGLVIAREKKIAA